MPYTHIEELGDRRQEKYLLGLTVQNLVGVLVLSFPAMLLTDNANILVRVLSIGSAIGLGIVLTTDMGGMALFEWALWTIRGYMRLLIRGTCLHPDALHGNPIQQSQITALRVGGPIRPAHWGTPPVPGAGNEGAEAPE